MSKVRVNVSTTVNNADIREEVKDGRTFLVVPSATLPDNVVMNGIMYPADEIEKSYKSLEGTAAPLGHPMVNGQYVSASHPEAYLYNVGAINRNVERKDGRVWLEKWVDKEFAERNAPELIEAINSKQPIHTSTGLVLERIAVNGKPYKHEARKMVFDHDCFLLGEQGAATPEQGVGVFVNSAGDQLQVINSELNSEKREKLASMLPDDAWLIDFTDEKLYYNVDGKDFEQGYSESELIGEAVQVKQKTVWERIGNALKPKSNPVQVDKMTKEEMQALLQANAEQTAAAVAEQMDKAVAPLKEEIEQLKAEKAEAQNAALADKRKIVAEQLGEEVANALTGNALDQAVAKLQSVDRVGNSFQPAADENPLTGYER